MTACLAPGQALLAAGRPETKSGSQRGRRRVRHRRRFVPAGAVQREPERSEADTVCDQRHPDQQRQGRHADVRA